MRGTVLVISTDLLFPSSSGGRLAILGQCRALAHAGFDIALVVFHRDPIGEEDRLRHLELVPNAMFVRRPGLFTTTIRHPFQPYQTSSRLFPAADIIEKLELKTAPVAIMSHQEWTLPTAISLSKLLRSPIILCSQNDEFEYLNALIRNGRGVSRLYHRLELLRLKLTISRTLASAASVTILSEGDRDFYENRGLPTMLVQPVLTGSRSIPDPRTAPPSPKIIFVGSLDLTHTVAGLLWFVRDVLPLILAKNPAISFHVAGRRASDRLSAELTNADGLHFHGEIDDIGPLFDDARVFVNPVFEGSGINIKMGGPSEIGLPIVTTSVGIRGLDAIADAVLHADTAEEFARDCLLLIEDDREWERRSRALQEGIQSFSLEGVSSALENVIARTSGLAA